MSKKWNKILALSPVLIAPGFLTSCIDLVINKDLVSNKSNKKANIITTDKPIFNLLSQVLRMLKLKTFYILLAALKTKFKATKFSYLVSS